MCEWCKTIEGKFEEWLNFFTATNRILIPCRKYYWLTNIGCLPRARFRIGKRGRPKTGTSNTSQSEDRLRPSLGPETDRGLWNCAFFVLHRFRYPDDYGRLWRAQDGVFAWWLRLCGLESLPGHHQPLHVHIADCGKPRLVRPLCLGVSDCFDRV